MNPDLLATVFIPVFDLDANLVGHVHRGEDEEGVQLSSQRISLLESHIYYTGRIQVKGYFGGN